MVGQILCRANGAAREKRPHTSSQKTTKTKGFMEFHTENVSFPARAKIGDKWRIQDNRAIHGEEPVTVSEEIPTAFHEIYFLFF